jgi:hypothetical protein
MPVLPLGPSSRTTSWNVVPTDFEGVNEERTACACFCAPDVRCPF